MTKETRQLDDASEYRPIHKNSGRRDHDRLMAGFSASETTLHAGDEVGTAPFETLRTQLQPDECIGYAAYVATGAAMGVEEQRTFV
jgi:hypothetical protein